MMSQSDTTHGLELERGRGEGPWSAVTLTRSQRPASRSLGSLCVLLPSMERHEHGRPTFFGKYLRAIWAEIVYVCRKFLFEIRANNTLVGSYFSTIISFLTPSPSPMPPPPHECQFRVLPKCPVLRRCHDSACRCTIVAMALRTVISSSTASANFAHRWGRAVAPASAASCTAARVEEEDVESFPKC